ncbi:MAG: tetratricopeptide repeat protein [Pseudomonadota bacterium]
MSKLCPLPLICLLCGCSWLPGAVEPDPPTLADLEPAMLPENQAAPAPVALTELAALYSDVLSVEQDTETTRDVRHRLADIHMLDGEAKLVAADGDASTLSNAVSGYQRLLEEYPHSQQRDHVLYQLSKAYDLSGDSVQSLAVLEQLDREFPQSAHALEARFRRAESYFVAADYAQAQQKYAEVIQTGPSTFFTRAQYMQGWSLFKQGFNSDSIEAFYGTLDALLVSEASLQHLTRGDRELAADCLRVLAVVFSYLEGTDTIAATYPNQSGRDYHHLLYESLGDLYLDQERFRDSAEVYRAFGREYPDSRYAHRFQLRVIEAFEAGGFGDQIIAARREYVAAFNPATSYWAASTPPEQADMAERLRQYMKELANHYHAMAQESVGGEVPQAASVEYYELAAHYYQLFLDSFPFDPKAPDMAFLLAESRYEAGDYASAIDAYELVAYGYPDFPQSADAGYMAILAHGQQADSSEDLTARLARVQSELRFFAAFPEDVRAPAVQGHAASELLSLRDYGAAVAAASTLIDKVESLSLELRIPALLVIGNGEFQLSRFVQAEAAYQQALQVLPDADERYEPTRDQLAASVYKQAEQSVALGDDVMAASQFERVMKVAPESAARRSAQYDAASAHLREGNLDRGNALLVDFRERYPDDELSRGIGGTLVANYEALGNWSGAARELDGLSTGLEDGEQRRQALLMSADYYERGGQTGLAIERYRSYAHEYPDPFAESIETMQHLADLYDASGQQEKRRFWLQKLISAHTGAVDSQTERSTYLVARAAGVFANDHYQKFRAVELSAPLDRSLPGKQEAMARAVDALETANGYGIEGVSTRATYQLGEVYRHFGQALMLSPRPAGLDELALEQYELLLEEQAYPFEEQAISIHEANMRRSWRGTYDQWVVNSFVALAELAPGRYAREEMTDSDRQYPELVRSYNVEALKLRQQGHFEAAEQVWLASLVEFEPHPATHRNLGILYDLYRGDAARALRHYRRYLALTAEGDRRVAGWVADLERRQVLLVRGDS